MIYKMKALKKTECYNTVSLSGEIWANIPDYEGLYQASNLGRIKALSRPDTKGRVRREQILTYFGDGHGYYNKVKLHRDHAWTVCIHKLVALAFLPNPNNYKCINHKDGDKLNNKLENLEWCSHKQNTAHAWNTGLSTPMTGERHGCSVLTNEDVLFIRKTYKRGIISYRELGEKFGVGQGAICSVVKRKTWTHI